ncbi:hypothetical protein [uncultured Arcticibacterium sp.]|uniref:hypothetical protein n=1 Tax=uncultured Arcticibacterium sp. TaxID=2173042 RepID=UPI0030FA7BAF
MKNPTIQILKKAIEARLNWGAAEGWSNYDFEKLSDEILEVTEVSLSVSTLKRFFGKVKYQNKPSFTTLNTLAAFVGYEDWRSFETEAASENSEEIIPSLKEEKPVEKRAFELKPYLYSSLVLLLVAALFLYLKSKPKYNLEDFQFSSKTMLSKGLPNSVVFDYDATAANENDTVFISQNWDVRRKFAVDRNKRHHSSIYYYPGYYRAKLMAGDYILKEHDIQIITDGWLGVLANTTNDMPLYFSKEEVYEKDAVVASKELLEKYDIGLTPDLPLIWFSNQKDLEGFKTDNFEFEIEVKSSFSEGKAACQNMQIMLQAKDDILIIPLAQPACVGNMYLAAYGFGTDSKSADLSGFGADLHEWTKIKVVCIDREVQFFVNGNLAYKATTQNPVNEIVGVHARFEGPGSIRNTVLRSGGMEVVFD